MSPQTLDKSTTFAALPPDWQADLLPQIRQQAQQLARKLVVLDDDPTGTQTVYDIPVLTEWAVDSLKQELLASEPVFYILTNSRSLPLPAAQALNAEIGRNLVAASEQSGRDFAVVSRSDSTLRGHFPGEVMALAAAIKRSFDGLLIIPYFLEGGRFTIDDVHYVAEGDKLVPAAETPFAKDAAFGYRNSDLKAWVEEKMSGRVAAASVHSISLDDIRIGGPDQVCSRLLTMHDGAIAVINCVTLRDMQVFVSGLLAAEAQGKQFVYRTAASFVQIRAGLATRPLLSRDQMNATGDTGGLVVVGSYVPKTTGQLGALLASPQINPLEVNVPALLADDTQSNEISRVHEAADQLLRSGRDVVIYTSRTLISSDSAEASLAIGQRVSASLVAIVKALQTRPRYLLAKGGITSSDLATQALGIRRAIVLGQILPGVPVWQSGPESRHPGMPYIVFPGNVGGETALVDVVKQLK
ncbi:MAG: four-carbon acid sugar kinase family protein [Caldilineaceae bacterium]